MDAKSSNKDTIRITVKSMTRDERFVVPHEATVADIKPIIAERFNTEANNVHLIYAGRKLNDQRTLSAQNVRDGFAVHLVIRPANRDLSFTPPAEARINSTNWEPLSDISSHLISNPDYLRTLIESDPRLRAYVDQHADIQFAINNPDVLRHYIEVISDPQLLQEFLRERGVEAQHTSNSTDGLGMLHVMYDNLLRAQTVRQAENRNTSPENGTNQDTQSTNDQLTEAQMLSELLNSPQMQQFFQQLITDPSFLQSLLNNNAALQDPRMREFVQTNFGEILRNLETPASGPGPQPQANSNEAPEVRYTNQLEQLNLMGFTNRDANLQALVISSGDLNLAIDALTRNL